MGSWSKDRNGKIVREKNKSLAYWIVQGIWIVSWEETIKGEGIRHIIQTLVKS